MDQMTLLNAKLAAKIKTSKVLAKVIRELKPEEVNNGGTNMASATPSGTTQPAGGAGIQPAGNSVPSGVIQQ